MAGIKFDGTLHLSNYGNVDSSITVTGKEVGGAMWPLPSCQPSLTLACKVTGQDFFLNISSKDKNVLT